MTCVSYLSGCHCYFVSSFLHCSCGVISHLIIVVPYHSGSSVLSILSVVVSPTRLCRVSIGSRCERESRCRTSVWVSEFCFLAGDPCADRPSQLHFRVSLPLVEGWSISTLQGWATSLGCGSHRSRFRSRALISVVSWGLHGSFPRKLVGLLVGTEVCGY